MNKKCGNCSREFDSNSMFYCKKCKKFFCNDCKNIIFNLANNEEDLLKYLINSQDIRIYCNDCEKTYMLNEIFPNHINHDINFITINEKNKKKLLITGDRGCGPGCTKNNITLHDFLKKYNVNEDLKNIILSHEPILIQQNKVLPFRDTIYVYPTYNIYILNKDEIMLDLWNEGHTAKNINLEVTTSKISNRTMFCEFLFKNLRNNELKNVNINYYIYNSEKTLSADELDESKIEILYDNYIELNMIKANSKKYFSVEIPLSKKDLIKNNKKIYSNKSEIKINYNSTFVYFNVYFQNFLGEHYNIPLLSLPIKLMK